MAEFITKCGRCGCREFTVVERCEWRGEVDDSGVLNCTGGLGGVCGIRCTDCGTTYATNRFARIDFN